MARVRNKRYRPKHVHVPVMPELQDVFAFDMHGALTALRFAPNEGAFDQLGRIFNVISIATHLRSVSSPILQSGVRALQQVSERFGKYGRIHVAAHELPPIANAVFECERLIPQFDIETLYHATRILSAQKTVERTMS